MDEDTADGKPRGFFTCTTPPSDTQDTHASPEPPPPAPTPPIITPNPRLGIHGAAIRGSSLSAPTREWWEVSHQRALRRGPLPLDAGPVTRGAGSGFQFDVPEHLPGSPLCPANGRHKSGGTGVCVYHGRGKAKSLLRDADRVSPSELGLLHGYESAMP